MLYQPNYRSKVTEIPQVLEVVTVCTYLLILVTLCCSVNVIKVCLHFEKIKITFYILSTISRIIFYFRTINFPAEHWLFSVFSF